MTVQLSSLGGAAAQFFDSNGTPLVGGFVYTYVAGTSTPQATYTTALGNIAHSNPIQLDAAGRVPGGEIWLVSAQNYKFVVKTSTNVLIGTYDNITGIDGTGIATNAANVEYDPPFTGAVTNNYTVQDKLEQYVSVKDFGAKGDGVTDDGAAINACFAASGVGSVYFPLGVYKTSVQITNNGKSAKGDGWGVSKIQASAAIASVFKFSGQNQVVEELSFDGGGLATHGVIMQGCNTSVLRNYGVENVTTDGVHFPNASNNNGNSVIGGLIRYVGTTYTTGTATVSAGGSTVTITGAADLTTLGFRVATDFIKVGSQRAREITAITANTISVYPAFVGAETNATYSLRKGSGIFIANHGDNSREKLWQNTIQFAPVAGIDQAPLYGATCIGNIIEFCEFGHIIGRRSIGTATFSSEDIGSYYEGCPSGNFLFGGPIGCDIISPNSDGSMAQYVFQPSMGNGVRIRQGIYDLSEVIDTWANNVTITPTINTTNYIIGAQDAVVTLPDVPAQTVNGDNGIGSVYAFHVRLIITFKAGHSTTIKSNTKVNGVAGATGVVVYGDNKVYDCYAVSGAEGWYVGNITQPMTFDINSGGGIGAGGVITYAVSGIDCVSGVVSVTAWGGGENAAADAYLVGYSVTNRTTTGCDVNIKNLAGNAQTLSACIVVTPY